MLISIGTIFILYGIKPRFNDYPKARKGSEPASIFFYKKIIELEHDNWNNFLSNITIDELLDKATNDLIKETYLIAGKIKTKVKWSNWGFMCYLLSIIFMVAMAIAMVILAAVSA